MFNRVMITASGSEISKKAAKTGVNLARVSGGKVFAVYIADVLRLANLSGCGEFSDVIREDILNEGKKVTGDIEEIARDMEVPCEKIVIERNPRDELMKIFQKDRIELLIIGNTDCGTFRKLLPGGIAEKAARQSKVPIQIV